MNISEKIVLAIGVVLAIVVVWVALYRYDLAHQPAPVEPVSSPEIAPHIVPCNSGKCA